MQTQKQKRHKKDAKRGTKNKEDNAMMYEEFEKLVGYEVPFEIYDNIIEPMYMATNLSKQEFVEVTNFKKYALKTEKQLIAAMKKAAQKCFAVWGHCNDYEAEHELQAALDEYNKRFMTGEDNWAYIHREYEYPGMRGCTCPTELVLCGKYGEYKRVRLVKAA